jgi:hypothetical protein
MGAYLQLPESCATIITYFLKMTTFAEKGAIIDFVELPWA